MARCGSLVTFVRETIPGERVRIKQAQMHNGYQTAALAAVLEAVPERTIPLCHDYGVCGGCQLQHIDAQAQLRYKHHIVQETLFRIGHIQLDSIALPLASPTPFHYRSWMRFVVDTNGALGLHQEGTHRLVETLDCLLPVKPLKAVLTGLRERLRGEQGSRNPIDQVELRHSLAFGTTVLIFRAAIAGKQQAHDVFERFASLPGVVGQVLYQRQTGQKSKRSACRYSIGEDSLMERFHDLTFSINDRSFMQAQWPMYETIGHMLCEWVQPGDRLRVLELYAGIGCLGLSLARQGALVTLVEANSYALRDARNAAKVNHIGRTRFRLAKAETYLASLQPGECDVVILDPPRAGLSKDCLGALIRLQAPRIFYLSCDTPSLARDLSRLRAGGYHVLRLQNFDMFPQTAHLETLVELVRRSSA